MKKTAESEILYGSSCPHLASWTCRSSDEDPFYCYSGQASHITVCSNVPTIFDETICHVHMFGDATHGFQILFYSRNDHDPPIGTRLWSKQDDGIPITGARWPRSKIFSRHAYGITPVAIEHLASIQSRVLKTCRQSVQAGLSHKDEQCMFQPGVGSLSSSDGTAVVGNTTVTMDVPLQHDIQKETGCADCSSSLIIECRVSS